LPTDLTGVLAWAAGGAAFKASGKLGVKSAEKALKGVDDLLASGKLNQYPKLKNVAEKLRDKLNKVLGKADDIKCNSGCDFKDRIKKLCQQNPGLANKILDNLEITNDLRQHVETLNPSFSNRNPERVYGFADIVVPGQHPQRVYSASTGIDLANQSFNGNEFVPNTDINQTKFFKGTSQSRHAEAKIIEYVAGN